MITSPYGFLLALSIVLSVGCAGSVIWLIRDRDTPRWLDVAAAVLLLLVSAIFLGIIQDVLNGLPSRTPADKNLQAQYQIALLIIPFFTANLATSLIANALLSGRNYDGQVSLKTVLLRFFGLFGMFLFWLTPVSWALYAYYRFRVAPYEEA